MSITLEQAKEHLRVDGSDEDTLIASLNASAWDWIVRYTKLEDPELSEPETVSQLEIAQRLLVGEWYQRREATAERGVVEAPFAVHAICGPFRTPTVA